MQFCKNLESWFYSNAAKILSMIYITDLISLNPSIPIWFWVFAACNVAAGICTGFPWEFIIVTIPPKIYEYNVYIHELASTYLKATIIGLKKVYI